jgi:hypothetical protein
VQAQAEGMPPYVVQASPLSKLFMSEWQSRIEANPDLVFSSDEHFEVRVPRAFGGLTFYHNKPVSSHKVLPAMPFSQKHPDNIIKDLEGTISWLTGGPDGMRSEETDIYGIVALRVDLDISGALTDVALFAEADTETATKKAAKKYADLQQELLKKTKDALKDAKELANTRVRRALKTTHINLMRQYEILRTDGKGVYSPSVAEAVGAHILAQEIDKAGENRKKMLERLSQVMQETTIIR